MELKNYDAVIAGYTYVDLIPDFTKQSLDDNIPTVFKLGKLIEIRGMKFVFDEVLPNTGLAYSAKN